MSDRSPSGWARYIEGAAAGCLLVPRCRRCGQWAAPFSFRGMNPSVCGSCQGQNFAWDPVSGEAILVTWTVLPPGRSDQTPEELVSGVVELAEGPWLPCRVEVPPSDRRAGLEVKVVFDQAGSGPSAGVPVCRKVVRGGAR